MLLAIQTHRGCAFDLCGLRTRLVGGAVGEHVWKSLRAVVRVGSVELLLVPSRTDGQCSGVLLSYGMFLGGFDIYN